MSLSNLAVIYNVNVSIEEYLMYQVVDITDAVTHIDHCETEDAMIWFDDDKEMGYLGILLEGVKDVE